MFWSFEITQLLARDRISQFQREVERERLAKQAVTGQSGDGALAGLRSSVRRGEAMPPLWPRDRFTLGLRQRPPLPSFIHAPLPGHETPERICQSDGGED